MKKLPALRFGFWVMALLAVAAPALLAQEPLSDEDAAAMGLACMVFAVVAIVAFVVNILLAIWVARDAKARGESAALWVIVFLFTGLIGLIIWLFARPQGIVVPCPHCSNKRLQASGQCPHCGRE